MTLHTPGPWIFDEGNTGRDFNVGYGIYTNESGRTLVHIPLREADGIAEANARLIASAPDLLAELEIIANAEPSKQDWNELLQFREWAQSRARAAVAKVRAGSMGEAERLSR